MILRPSRRPAISASTRRRPAAPASLRDVFGRNCPFAAGDLPGRHSGVCFKRRTVETRQVRACAARYAFRRSATSCSSTRRFRPSRPTPFLRTRHLSLRPPWIAESLGDHAVAARHSDRRHRGGQRSRRTACRGLAADGSPTVVLTDINAVPCAFQPVNAALNGVRRVEVVESDLFAGSTAVRPDLSNPPYLVDPGRGFTARRGRTRIRAFASNRRAGIADWLRAAAWSSTPARRSWGARTSLRDPVLAMAARELRLTTKRSIPTCSARSWSIRPTTARTALRAVAVTSMSLRSLFMSNGRIEWTGGAASWTARFANFRPGLRNTMRAFEPGLPEDVAR